MGPPLQVWAHSESIPQVLNLQIKMTHLYKHYLCSEVMQTLHDHLDPSATVTQAPHTF